MALCAQTPSLRARQASPTDVRTASGASDYTKPAPLGFAQHLPSGWVHIAKIRFSQRLLRAKAKSSSVFVSAP